MAEVNRVGNAADGTVDNFGWPCAVGSGANSSYAGTAICQGLAASPAVQAPATHLHRRAASLLRRHVPDRKRVGGHRGGLRWTRRLSGQLCRCAVSGRPAPALRLGGARECLRATESWRVGSGSQHSLESRQSQARTWGRALLRRPRRRHHSTAHLRERKSTADRHHSGGTSHLRSQPAGCQLQCGRLDRPRGRRTDVRVGLGRRWRV